MNRKSKWQEHINIYTNFLTPYNFSCYLLMLSKSHYLIALSYMTASEEQKLTLIDGAQTQLNGPRIKL